MRAVCFGRFGGPETLEAVEVPRPVPAVGEVLVRVQAAGVNYFEALVRSGRTLTALELPFFPGVEVAGTVVETGAAVDGFLPGARVAAPLFAIGRAGGYAEYVAVARDSLVTVPADVTFEQATALLVQGLTALHAARLTQPAGRTVLVTAAAGGVGSLLIQLARLAGAKRVIAAASAQPKREHALEMGADDAVDYSRGDWVERVRALSGGGVDIAYDLVGNDVTRQCLGGLADGGQILLAAMGRFSLDGGDVERILARNQALRGLALIPRLEHGDVRADIKELFDLAASGKLRVVIGARLPLHEAAEAHRALETRASIGKIVLAP